MTDREAAAALIASGHTLVLATVTAAGEPHSAPLYYLPGEDFRLYWLSSPRSAHSRALARGASVSVFQPGDVERGIDWRGIRGVQMWGAARAVRGWREKARILEQYRQRFSLGAEFAPVIARTRLYVFEPARLRYIDNSRGFGYRAELALP